MKMMFDFMKCNGEIVSIKKSRSLLRDFLFKSSGLIIQ